MKHLALSRDGQRFTLTLPDTLPLRAAACAVRGARAEGVVKGLAVYSYPIGPDTCVQLLETFSPTVDANAFRTVERLRDQQRALQDAAALKDGDAELSINPLLQSDPMRQQVQALNFCAARFEAGARGSALLMEQRTGKSLVAVGLANWLHTQGRIRWALVVCPNSVKGTWASTDEEVPGEIAKHSAGRPRVLELRGDRARRLVQVEKALQRDEPGLLWMVTNWDQFAVDPGSRKHTGSQQFRQLLELVRRGPPGFLVFDESHAAKNHTAKRTKACLELAAAFPYRVILTGTPLVRAPLDLWSQFELVEEGCLGFNTYMAFERAYAQRTLRKVRRPNGTYQRFMEVTGYQNLPDLERRVAALSYRCRTEDCIDMPEQMPPVRLDVELSPAQVQVLKSLHSEMLADLGGGRLVDGRNVLGRYGKAAEVLGGWVHAMDSTGRKLDKPVALTPNAKLAALVDYLDNSLGEDPDRKAVIFTRHRAEVAGITAALARHGAVPFCGTQGKDERQANLDQFKKAATCRAFVATYSCGSEGVDLSVADTLVFYQLTFSWKEFAQAQRRLSGPKQKRRTTEVYLVAGVPKRRGSGLARTLDHTMLQALREKKDLADVVTGDWRAEMAELDQ